MWLFLATALSTTSMMALAHCWPGPSESFRALRIAAWESEKMYLLPSCPLASRTLTARQVAKSSASKTSLLLLRKKRLPVHPSLVC